MSGIEFDRPSLVGREIQCTRDAIRHRQRSGDGHFTHLCSERMKALSGAKKALVTHSCTAALEMAAISCDCRCISSLAHR